VNPRSSASSALSRFRRPRADAARALGEFGEATAGSLIDRSGETFVYGAAAEIQMVLWRICSPTQQREKERQQSGQRGKSREDLASARQRQSWSGRPRHLAQTWRAGELALLVRYAFTAERSSAMRTSRRRFT
jgi:hypothetical protein